ncbi:pancreatic triacylglycerol lipase-like isoform X2 [Dendropsophus ebraccatus]
MLLAVLMLLSMAVCVQGKTECFDDMICVSNDHPYWTLTRLISIFPQSPEEINTRLLLFTVNNTDQYQIIKPRNFSSLLQSHFDSSKNSVFIIHGYRDSGDAPWLKDMCQAILKKENVNCLCVDWSGGSNAIYFQAMNNIQVVGAEIAVFINILMEKFNYLLSLIHIIGHSLGAHAAGETGKRQPGIAKITGLDPARPGFEGESIVVSLDPSDADFVVVIHTDAGLIGFGMTKSIAHVDFFPNGKKRMPGCPESVTLDLATLSNIVGELSESVACNHVSSYYMFIESINNPSGFMGYCASSYSSFQKGAGFPCSNGSCSLMGYYTEPGDASPCREYYLNTGPRFNYQRWRYNVTVHIADNASTIASISLKMYNSSDFFDEQKIHSGSIVGGRTYSTLVDILFPPPITRVEFTRQNLLPFDHTPMLVDSVWVTYGPDGTRYDFCDQNDSGEDDIQILEPCL